MVKLHLRVILELKTPKEEMQIEMHIYTCVEEEDEDIRWKNSSQLHVFFLGKVSSIYTKTVREL